MRLASSRKERSRLTQRKEETRERIGESKGKKRKEKKRREDKRRQKLERVRTESDSVRVGQEVLLDEILEEWSLFQ